MCRTRPNRLDLSIAETAVCRDRSASSRCIEANDGDAADAVQEVALLSRERWMPTGWTRSVTRSTSSISTAR